MCLGVPLPAPSLLLLLAGCCSATVVPCSYDGLRISSSTFRPSACVSCTCNTTTGRLTCQYEQCDQKEGSCSAQETVCCPAQCMPGCRLNGKFYARGSRIPSDDPCQQCTCKVFDNQKTRIECSKKTCNSCSQSEGECCSVCETATTISPREKAFVAERSAFVGWSSLLKDRQRHLQQFQFG